MAPTDSPVARARMPTSAPGNSVVPGPGTASAALPHRASRSLRSAVKTSPGFTLIELLVVVAIIAIATAGVSFAIRDSASTLLERDAQRLASLLESARAQSRSTGVAVLWY